MTLELFLILLIDNSITDIRVLYQRPKTGSLHFYSYYEIMSRDATQKGVNALNGLSSFLRESEMATEKEVLRRVNALNGLSSFLRREWEAEKERTYKCVNALNGLSSFLLIIWNL